MRAAAFGGPGFRWVRGAVRSLARVGAAAVVVLLAATGMVAQEPEPGADPVADSTPQQVLIPTLYYSPETSLAMGALYARVWRAAPGTRESSSSVNATYTLKNQLVVGSISELRPRPGLVVLNELSAVLSWPDRFYPVGNAAGADAWEEWTARRVMGRLTGLWRAGHRKLFAGPVVDFGHFEVLEREPGGLLDGGLAGVDGHTLLGLGARAMWDGRDAAVWPTRGGYHTATVTGYTSVAGARFTLGRLDVDVRGYRALGPGVVAARTRLITAWGDVPFTMHGTVGGLVGVRGIYELRYADRTAALGVVEYRLPVVWRLGVVAFAGAGRVAPTVAGLSTDGLHFGAGGGVRFALLEASRLNVGVDIARGPDETYFYVTLGEAF